MSSTIRCGVCSTCFTLLVSLDSVGGGLGRARVVSRQRVLFSSFCQNIQPPIRTYRYIPITVYVHKKSGVAGRLLPVLSEGLWFESPMALCFVCQFHLFRWRHAFCYKRKIKIRAYNTIMIEVSSEQSRSQLYKYMYRYIGHVV